jgi:zinc protease
MEAKVKKVLGGIPATVNPTPKQYFPIPDNEEPVIATATDPDLAKSTIVLYIKRPATPIEDNSQPETMRRQKMISMAQSVMNERLGDMPQLTELRMSLAGMGNNRLSVLSDYLSIGAEVRGDSILLAFEVLYTELERLRRHGITEEELCNFRTRTLEAMEMAKANSNSAGRNNSSLASMYISNFLTNSPILASEDSYEVDREIMSSFDAGQINSMLREMITLRNNVLLITAPQKDDIVKPSRDEFLDVMRRVRESEIGNYDYASSDDEPLIAPAAATAIVGGRVEREQAGIYGSTEWMLGNGMQVVLLPTDFNKGWVTIDGWADGGVSTVDDVEYPAAQALAQMVGTTGVGDFTQEWMEKLTSARSVRVTPLLRSFSTGFNGNGATKEIETMLQAVYLYFTAPRLDRKDFDASVDRLRPQSHKGERTPGGEFSRRIDSLMYGDSPHRRIEADDKFDFDTMLALYDRFFSHAAGNYTFYIVGDFIPADIKSLVEKYLGGLPTGASKLIWRDEGAKIRRGTITDRFAMPMQVPQSRVQYVWSGDIEYTQQNVMTMSFLADCLSNRYLESIREEKGGTYSISATGSVGRQPRQGYRLNVSFMTDPALTDELATIVETELQTIADRGPLPEDMTRAIEYRLKTRPETQRQNSTWVGYLRDYHVWGEMWNDTWEQTIRGMTAEKIQVLARKILDDGNMIKVIMEPQK